MEVYLDNSATTRPFESVKDIMIKTLENDYGNPSSLHQKGVDAERYIKEAKDIIAKNMKVQPKEIIFTSGGTESNNHALIGCAMANKRNGNHIITTKFEHPSVYNPLIFLENNGFKVTYLSVNKNGHIDFEQLEQVICNDTIIVSIMYVNNEVGAVQNIDKISKLIKSINKNIIFHVDAIQAYGKYKIYPKRQGIDLLSISGHKIHGPKGIGILYVNSDVKINSIIYGGGQQKDMRSGTENVTGIAGIGQAVKEIYENHEEKINILYELKTYFISKLKEIEGVYINAVTEDIKDTAPHIISVSFENIKSEVLLHALEEKNIYVSSGSACSSNHPSISGTLQAIGVKSNYLDSTIRFSMSVYTTKEELDYTIKVLKNILPILRKFVKR